MRREMAAGGPAITRNSSSAATAPAASQRTVSIETGGRKSNLLFKAAPDPISLNVEHRTRSVKRRIDLLHSTLEVQRSMFDVLP
jgi:hypothetical protein